MKQILHAYSHPEFKELMDNDDIFEDIAIRQTAAVISITESSDEHYFSNDDNILNIEFMDDDSLRLEKALDIVRFIHDNITKDFYVHCSAGKSRSQAIVRYILDCYPEYDWSTRIDNPCETPNYYVVRQLKKCHEFLYG